MTAEQLDDIFQTLKLEYIDLLLKHGYIKSVSNNDLAITIIEEAIARTKKTLQLLTSYNPHDSHN